MMGAEHSLDSGSSTGDPSPSNEGNNLLHRDIKMKATTSGYQSRDRKVSSRSPFEEREISSKSHSQEGEQSSRYDEKSSQKQEEGSAEAHRSLQTDHQAVQISPSFASPDWSTATSTVFPSSTLSTSNPSSATSNIRTYRGNDQAYLFRKEVEHLPPEERKERYEEEIRRLLNNPHPTHLARLMPEKVQHEKADIPPTVNKVVTWNESQLTYDIGKGALSQRAFKRCNRSRPDPWRRYGALRKLHEIGGIGCTPPSQPGVRNNQKFYVIEPGSSPPPPPVNPPITTIEEYGTVDVLLNPKKRRQKEGSTEKTD